MLRSNNINWNNVELLEMALEGLDNPFTTMEIWEAIKDSCADKAPEPDDFNGVFYRKCWGVIRLDIKVDFDHV